MALGDMNNLTEYLRDTTYNRSVALSAKSVNKIPEDFDGIFNGFVNYTETISFIKAFPFRIATTSGSSGFCLDTAEGIQRDIPARALQNGVETYSLGCKKIDPYFNNFMDYKGYTCIKALLPFLGFVDLDVNECMNKYVHFALQVDYYTGSGLYFIYSYNTDSFDNALRYGNLLSSYEVNIGMDIPLGSSNYGDMMRNVALGVVKTAAAVALAYTGNIAAAAGVVTTSVTEPTSYSESYAIEGQERGTEKGSRLKTTKTLRGAREGTQGRITTTETKVRPVNKLKPYAEAVDGSADALRNAYPAGSSDRSANPVLNWSFGTDVVIYIYRPKVVSFNDNYDETFEEPLGELYGRPLGEFRTLGSLTGHTSIAAIEIQGEDFNQCTNKELEMLENILVDDIIL